MAAASSGAPPSTVMPSARARSASRPELGPAPARPRVLPRTSTTSPGLRVAAAPARSAASAPEKIAGARKDERERVLGLGDERAVGRVHDDDAAPGGFGDVHISEVHSRPADDLELVARRQDGRGHGRTGAGDERVAARYAAQYLGFVPTGAGLDGQSLPKEVLDTLAGEVAEDDHSLLLAHLAASREGGPIPAGPVEQGRPAGRDGVGCGRPARLRARLDHSACGRPPARTAYLAGRREPLAYLNERRDSR